MVNSLVCMFLVQLVYVAYHIISYKFIKNHFSKLIFLMIVSLILIFDAFFEFTTLIKIMMDQISKSSGVISFEMIKRGIEDVILYELGYIIIIFINVILTLAVLFYKGKHSENG